MRNWQFLFATLALATIHSFFASPATHAALVGGGPQEFNGNPIQDIVLLPGTPFNSGTEEVLLADVEAFGGTTFDRLDQIGTNIVMINGSFTGSGRHQDLGAFTLRTGPANGFDQMVAQLTNVVQDENHPGFDAGDPASIVSADISFTVPNWGVDLTDAGVGLEVRDSFSFTGTLDGLPPSDGTTIADPFAGSGTDRLDIYLAGTDTVIGFSENRRFTFNAVPEPSGLMGILMVGGVAVLKRHGARSRHLVVDTAR